MHTLCVVAKTCILVVGHGLIKIGFTRGVIDPTKFYHKARQTFVDTHVDDGHAAATGDNLWWMLGALKDVGIALKDTFPRGVGDSYEYLQRRQERLPEA